MHIVSLIGHTQEVLGAVLKSQKPADALIDSFFRAHKYLGSHDRKFVAETMYGTLRYLRKCELLVSTATAGLENLLREEDKVLLLILAYLLLKGKINSEDITQVFFKLGPQLQDKRITILDILSKPSTLNEESVINRIGVEYSFPNWIVGQLIEQYGEVEAEKICSSLNEQAPLTLRVNTLKTTVEQCQAELQKLGMNAKRTVLSPLGLILDKRINIFSLPLFRDGWFEVQDEGSQLLPVLIDPKPNSKLLDVCAGAGGKTLEFSALMKNRGEIFASDIHSHRLEELRRRMKRAGVQNVRIREIQAIEDLTEQYAGFFDTVFIDAPCSGLGTIRRNPGMKWIVTEQTMRELSEKQQSILHSSAGLVKAGGRLVYATCTMLRQENEENVNNFISKHPEFVLTDASKFIGTEKRSLARGSFIALLPHIHGTDGFFCAVLERQTVR
jgi:16S rRNA (cytosine967-C5)-methyltransferase